MASSNCQVTFSPSNNTAGWGRAGSWLLQWERSSKKTETLAGKWGAASDIVMGQEAATLLLGDVCSSRIPSCVNSSRFPGWPTEAYLAGVLVPWGPEKTSAGFVIGLKPGGPRERRLCAVKS